MQKTPPSVGRILTMVFFALSCFGLILFLWLSFGGATPLKPKGYRVNVLLPQAFGLGPQVDVRTSGVSVGKIIKLDRDGSRTRAEIELRSRYVPLRSDAHAILRRKTLLGETYVELTPGRKTARAIPDGGTLPARNVAQSVELDEILRSFDRRTRDAIKLWFKEFDRGLAARGEDVSQIAGHLPGATQSAADILGVLRSQRVATTRIIRDTGRAFAAIGRPDARVQELITSSRRLFEATAASERDLAATTHEAGPFLRSLRTTLASVERLSPSANAVFRDLRPGARLLDPTLERGAALTPDLRTLAGSLNDLADVGPAGLGEATRIVKGLGPLFDALRPFGRQLAPIAQFLELYKTELVNSWGKVASAVEARTLDPSNGGAIHTLRSTVYVGNEYLAVADKRQPYSRPVAYMTPGGMQYYAQNKVLRAFDCSHLSNPLTVPPLLPGVQPPCILQGPISFQGISASYPRVREAP
jgi:virulence factor Mce-like protein